MRARRSPALVVGALAVLASTVTGCVPEPASTPSASAIVSPEPTPTSDPPVALPTECDEIYSADMLAELEADVPPLDDPGITMLSSQIVTALETLDSGIPTLRCTWGPPSERGIATNVSQIDDAQAASLREALLQEGFSEEEFDGGTIYRIRQETVAQDDALVAMGEEHFIDGTHWVSTRWINAEIAGYTEDIVRTVWG
ncbi:hypothetical protein GCM10009775_27930 [Microbacterium aoyamense]|uniref:Uncharacterized protein n=1 Tax=Microbacterium aoyamense TaxID=344166 RepID=A0ABN2PYB8_9MICO|nr:hypothetical protein [Microbacterium aoyamense]